MPATLKTTDQWLEIISTQLGFIPPFPLPNNLYFFQKQISNAEFQTLSSVPVKVNSMPVAPGNYLQVISAGLLVYGTIPLVALNVISLKLNGATGSQLFLPTLGPPIALNTAQTFITSPTAENITIGTDLYILGNFDEPATDAYATLNLLYSINTI